MVGNPKKGAAACRLGDTTSPRVGPHQVFTLQCMGVCFLASFVMKSDEEKQKRTKETRDEWREREREEKSTVFKEESGFYPF